MIKGRKILVTGASGVVARPIACALAQDNEVWGLARLSDASVARELEADGIRPVAADLGGGDFAGVPRDFDYLLHFAWWRAPIGHLDEAIRTNVEGAGLLLSHCRDVKAALVVSGMGVYGASADPWHAYSETDAIGRGATAYAATSPVCKVGLEAVARLSARLYDLPVTIARLNTAFGLRGTYFAKLVECALDGTPFTVPFDPNPHSPIHSADMIAQIPALLEAASVPATIVNWCGDEMVTTQQAAELVERLSGRRVELQVRSFPGAPTGTGASPEKRRTITGPCERTFVPELERLYHAVVAARS